MNQLLELFGDLQSFLMSKEEFSSTTRNKLLTSLADPQICAVLKVELATVIDVGKPFVQGKLSTYQLQLKIETRDARV